MGLDIALHRGGDAHGDVQNTALVFFPQLLPVALPFFSLFLVCAGQGNIMGSIFRLCLQVIEEAEAGRSAHFAQNGLDGG